MATTRLIQMHWLPIGFLGVHPLIHVVGFLKAFGYVERAELTQPEMSSHLRARTGARAAFGGLAAPPSRDAAPNPGAVRV